MIRRLQCSLALMCVVPDSPLFRFGKKEPRFLYSCRCRDHCSEFRPTSIKEPSKSNDSSSKTAQTSLFRKQAASQIDLSSLAPRAHQPNQWHDITGDVNLVGHERDGALHFRVKDAKNFYEVTVIIPTPESGHACEIRKEMARWSNVKIALSGQEMELNLKSKSRVMLTGKAFYSKDYAPDGNSPGQFQFRKSNKSNIALWELQPVLQHDLIHDA